MLGTAALQRVQRASLTCTWPAMHHYCWHALGVAVDLIVQRMKLGHCKLACQVGAAAWVERPQLLNALLAAGPVGHWPAGKGSAWPDTRPALSAAETVQMSGARPQAGRLPAW